MGEVMLHLFLPERVLYEHGTVYMSAAVLSGSTVYKLFISR